MGDDAVSDNKVDHGSLTAVNRGCRCEECAPLADGLCPRRCDVFVGYGGAGVVRVPPAHADDPAWLASHCWLCEWPDPDPLVCTCGPDGCDEEGDPGCPVCQVLDHEMPCPAEAE